MLDRLRSDIDMAFSDLHAILRALDLGDHARPISAHEVVIKEVIPEIEKRRLVLMEAEEALHHYHSMRLVTSLRDRDALKDQFIHKMGDLLDATR